MLTDSENDFYNERGGWSGEESISFLSTLLEYKEHGFSRWPCKKSYSKTDYWAFAFSTSL